MPKMLLRDAAAKLNVSEHFLRIEARAGRIPCFKIGNRYIIDTEQVDEFLKQRAMENLQQPENVYQYGALRKVKG